MRVLLANKRVMVVIPAFNEAGKILHVVDSLPSFADHKVVVDDGSTDETGRKAEAVGALVLRHAENRGVGAAIRTGCNFAKASDSDIVVFMAGDGQSDPSDMQNLLNPIVFEGYEFVQGSRFLREHRAMPWIRFTGNRILLLMFKILVRGSVSDYTSGYRAIATSALKRLDIPEDRFHRYEMEPWILIQATKKLRWKEVPVRCIYGKNTSKMKPLIDWGRFVPPLLTYACRSVKTRLKGESDL